MQTGSWLFAADVDRKRMLELDHGLRRTRRQVFVIMAIALLACGPWLGWWTLGPVVLAAGIFRLAEAYIDRSQRPEYAMFAAWTLSEVIVAASVALSGGATIPTMSWLAIPLLTLGARFSERGIIAGTAIALFLLFAIAFGVDAHAVIDTPPLLIAPVTLMLAVSLFQTVLMRSEVKYRAASVIDPLTGLLNRGALVARAAELEQQSAISRQPVAIIMADLDHFKLINDTFGHADGDFVLKDIAYEMRKVLRAFDLIYRLGGEEFLVFLPGADLDSASERAEAMRCAIEAVPHGGHEITISLGVAASSAGAAFDYRSVLADADEALYKAKRLGRNRVCRHEQALEAAA